MKHIFSFRAATRWSLGLFGFFVVFHLAVILGIVLFDYAPVEYLWGGRMQTEQELLQFEILSLAIMAVCLLVVLLKARILDAARLMGVVNILMWALVLLFALNTFGNLLAVSLFEKFFSIVTAAMMVLCLRLALGRS